MEGLTPQRLAPSLMAPDPEPELHTSEQQFEAELSACNNRLSFTPAVALALSTTTRNYSFLWSLAPHAEQAQPDPWQASLAGEQQQISSTSSADHSLKLHFSHLFRGDGGMVENPVQLHRRPLPVQWPHKVIV